MRTRWLSATWRRPPASPRQAGWGPRSRALCIVAAVHLALTHAVFAQRAPEAAPVPVAYDPALAGVALDPAWPKTLLFLADSVVLGIKPAVPKGLPDWQVSYAGRPSLMLVNAVDGVRQRKEPMPSVVVIGLGYNTLWSRHNTRTWSDKFDAAADELLRVLKEKGARKVVWVLLRELTPEMVRKGVITSKMLGDYWHYVEVNQRLRALKERNPELALADWVTPGRSAGLTIDAVHLNGRGATLMVEILKPAIGIPTAAAPAPPAVSMSVPGPAPPLAKEPMLDLVPLPPLPPAPDLQPMPQAEAPLRQEPPAAEIRPPGASASVVVQLNPGGTFRDCPQCPEMVVVPAGRFTMGAPESEADSRDEERPPRGVTIGRPFAVGKLEVTFDEWAACVEGGGCRSNEAPDDEGWGKGRRPVVNVSWDDTREYLDWLSKKTGMSYRLLSEAEWEYAARGGSTTPYASGMSITTRQANFNDGEGGDVERGGERYRERTLEVGSFAANAFGLHDMHGNVWEWVEDVWSDSHAGGPGNGSARLQGDDTQRVLRGGSWYRVGHYARSASRHSDITNTRSNEVGFRVARGL